MFGGCQVQVVFLLLINLLINITLMDLITLIEDVKGALLDSGAMIINAPLSMQGKKIV